MLQELYMQKANDLEAEGKLREAEKMLCTIKEYNAAIKMYRQRNMYDHVIRLVAQHHKVGHRARTDCIQMYYLYDIFEYGERHLGHLGSAMKHSLLSRLYDIIS